MATDYTFAVARIRGRELALLGKADLEQLMGCPTVGAALRLLADRGWGEPGREDSAEGVLAAEVRKTWRIVDELAPDEPAFDVLRLPVDYHNAKAAVKLVYTQAKVAPERLFRAGGTVDAAAVLGAVRERDYRGLPDSLADATREATETLLQTGDGQLCDMVLDRACLEAVWHAGRAAKDEVLRDYARISVNAANVRVAARCAHVGKSADFVRRALARAGTLDTKGLAAAAAQGPDALCDWLQGTDHAGAAEALRVSEAAFERWCDDSVVRMIRPQLRNPFGVGPLVAYVLARSFEVASVRMILTGKQTGLSEETVRARLRETYV